MNPSNHTRTHTHTHARTHTHTHTHDHSGIRIESKLRRMGLGVPSGISAELDNIGTRTLLKRQPADGIAHSA